MEGRLLLPVAMALDDGFPVRERPLSIKEKATGAGDIGHRQV